MGWTVSVTGKNLKGSMVAEWRATGTLPTDPPDFVITREGDFSAEALAAFLPLAFAERDAHLVSESTKQSVAQQIETALNDNDPGPGQSGGE